MTVLLVEILNYISHKNKATSNIISHNDSSKVFIDLKRQNITHTQGRRQIDNWGGQYSYIRVLHN